MLQHTVTPPAARPSGIRRDVSARLYRAWCDAEACGGDAHAWRVMSAVLAAMTTPIVERALWDGPVTVERVSTVLEDIRAGRQDAVDRIDAHRLTGRAVLVAQGVAP